MSVKFTSVTTKSGSVYYYKIGMDGKKVRVSKTSVPLKTLSKMESSKEKSTEGKKSVASEISKKKSVAPKIVKSAVEKKPEIQKQITSKPPKTSAPAKTSKKDTDEKKSAVEKKTVKIPKQIVIAEPPKIIICQFGRGVAYPKKEGFKNYPIHSRGAMPWKELSPFLIGPVEFINLNGEKDSCPIFENYWQAQKVWKTVAKQNQKKPEWKWPAERHLGKDGNPNDAWYSWRDALCHHEKPVRRPNGRAVPEYAWYMNKKTKEYEKLNTVQSRKAIYIPILKKLYRAHPVYKKMLEEFRKGQNMVLIEPDGPWNVAYPEGREVTLELLYELIEKMNYTEEGYPKQYSPYGHGFVAATCLLEDF